MSEEQQAVVPALTVHILKEGRSYCNMSGVPASWPDHHVYISYQDQENAKEANCPECVAHREAGPGLSERLNVSNAEPIPSVVSGSVRYCLGRPPEGVAFDSSGLDAFEEKTGQAAHFDVDLGRWSKIG